MNLLSLPWLELSVVAPLAGGVVVGRVRDVAAAARWCLGLTGLTLGFTLLAWAGYEYGPQPAGDWSTLAACRFDPAVFAIDGLTAPLLPLVALLHFLTVLATARTKMERFPFGWLLASESVRLATFACVAPWWLIALLAVGTVPPYVELIRRGRPTRVYVLHMAVCFGLLVLGWAAVDADIPVPRAWAAVPLFAAVLVRSGVVPAHLWVADLFENASFGTALLFVTPITGVYVAIRLVLPVAPDWVLDGIGLVSLVTAVYAAGMATVQTDARRFFAFLFLSHASLILIGLELHTSISLTGSLALWGSVVLSVGGLGLTLRALEARLGRLGLTGFLGLYDHSPALAVCFLLTGLASVGFPGTPGFIATELLIDGAVEANPLVGLGVVLATALNGIAILRAYLLLFTGGRHLSAVSLGITPRERFAVLLLAVLLIGGGLYPRPGIVSRHSAAEAVLGDRLAHQPAADTPAQHD